MPSLNQSFSCASRLVRKLRRLKFEPMMVPSYMNQEGTIIGSNFNRYSFRTNLDAKLKEWFKLGINAMYAETNDNVKLADGQEGVIFYSLSTLPDIPVDKFLEIVSGFVSGTVIHDDEFKLGIILR